MCHSKEGGAQKSLLLIRVSYSKNCSNKCLYTKSLISLLPQPTKTNLLVEQRERKIYYRKTEKCDCKKLYEGDEDFLIRIGGSFDLKNQTRSVHLISYSLLLEFTLHFMHNGQTMNSFYHAHFANCQFKFGMEESQIMTLVCWKKAVGIFWQDILKLNINKMYTCDNCGSLPSTFGD